MRDGQVIRNSNDEGDAVGKKIEVDDFVTIYGMVKALVVYPGGVRCAVVQTGFGNAVVEPVDEISAVRVEDGSPVAPIEERLEKLARTMAVADGVDPDARAMLHMPYAIATGFVLQEPTFEAWRLYAKYARSIIDAGLS